MSDGISHLDERPIDEKIIEEQKREIITLRAENEAWKSLAEEMAGAMNAYVHLEAELINDGWSWDTPSGVPRISQDYFDKWIAVQGQRNTVLAKHAAMKEGKDE